MGAHPPQSKAINRRSLLTQSAALVGGAAAGLALTVVRASADEKPKTGGQPVAKPAAAVEPPNLHPPVAQVKGGKLRGFKDGKIFSFLGVPYAQAERFEMPKPVPAWEGIKNAQVWGPVCPIPPASTVGSDDFVFPHR
jgi:para-nitrobenzyl esterase